MATHRIGNHGYAHTLESAGYLFNPFVPGADLWGHDPPFNNRESKKDELLTAQGIPRLNAPSVAQQEHVTTAETEERQQQSSRPNVLQLLAAGIIIAGAFLI